MIELTVLVAKIAPEELLIKKMKEAISMYEKEKTTENRNILMASMDILQVKLATEGHSAKEVIETASMAEKLMEILKKAKGQ